MRSHEIRHRVVVAPNGRLIEAFVFCPYQCRTLTLGLHLSCEHGHGVATEGSAEVACCGRPGVDDLPPLLAVPAVHWRRPGPALAPTPAASLPVSAVVPPSTICAAPDLPLRALQDLLFELGLSGVPVVQPDGTPLGVVSDRDLVRLLADRQGGGQVDESGGPTVADAMTPFTHALPESSPLSQAAAYMAYKHIHRLAILSSSGRLVGVLSALDVLRWLGEHDGYVAT